MAIDFGTSSSLTEAGTTTLLGISSAGHITKPLQPAFNAFGVTGTTQGNYVIFPSVQFDRTSSYNTSNGRFTAPVAGRYYFYYQQITNAVAGEYRAVFYKNAAWYSGSNYIFVAGAAQYMSLYCSQHIDLAVNDYVNVLLITAPAAMYAGAGDVAYGQFSGHLIG